MKQKIIEFLKKDTTLNKLDLDKLLSKPKIETQGDFSLPMFILSKELKKSPQEIAKEYQQTLTSNKNKPMPKFIIKIEAAGPFLNFYLDNTKLFQETLTTILNSKKNKKGIKIQIKNSQKLLIEYPSPNTNKSLHLGHVRNILLGNALSKIFKKVEHEVIRVCLNNDRGIALSKSMIGYQKFHSNDSPESLNLKPDEFVSMCYIRFGKEAKKDPNLEKEAQEMLVAWENKDKKTRELWEKILNWVFEGYKQTYKNYKLEKFDKQYYESQIYDKGKEIVLKALKRKVKGFKKDEENGAILCDFEDKTLGKKYMLRGDGTTLYITQDIYLAYEKQKQFNADKYIFVVGQEQIHQFNALFEILDRLGFGGVEKNYHYAYGYVYDKNGKKYSSRKGEIIGADWLLNKITNTAKENLKTKELTKNLSENELNKRSKIIGYSALSFSFLKMNPLSDIKFDIENALAFEGETGPYVQYTYARIKSILRKAKINKAKRPTNKPQLSIEYVYNEKEINIIKLLTQYQEIVIESSNKYKPSSIIQYLIKLSQKLNEYYQSHHILSEEENAMQARLKLIEAVSIILKDGLEIIGIEVLEEM